MRYKLLSDLAYASRESGLTKVADMNRAQGRFNQSMMDSLEMGMKGFEGLKKPNNVTQQQRVANNMADARRVDMRKYK